MKDRERLIELIRKAKKNTKGANCDLEREMLFADYLLQSGVIVPPCKVGDTVYCIYRNRETLEWYIKEMTVYSISLHDTGFKIYVTPIISYIEMEIGVRLFLTREEAERALAERSDTE